MASSPGPQPADHLGLDWPLTAAEAAALLAWPERQVADEVRAGRLDGSSVGPEVVRVRASAVARELRTASSAARAC